MNLRAEAIRRGIQPDFVIKGENNTPEYEKAAHDFVFAESMLCLEDDDPKLLEILEKSGLKIDQYRMIMQETAQNAQKTMSELSADQTFPTNEFLSFVASKAEQTERKLSVLESKKQKSRKNGIKTIGLLAAVLALIAIVVFAFSSMNSRNKGSPVSESSGEGTPSKTKAIQYCAARFGNNYHTAGCNIISNEEIIYFNSLDDAKKGGRNPCPICIGNGSSSDAKKGAQEESKDNDKTYRAATCGKTYHDPNCDILSFWGDGIGMTDYASKEEAANSGKSPCEVCLGKYAGRKPWRIELNMDDTFDFVINSENTERFEKAGYIVEHKQPTSGELLTITTDSVDREAPLEIKASGGNSHYIKLESTSDQKQYVTFFVRAGSTVEVDVPFGSYYLKYASGDTWYGVSNLFGLKTTYTKSDDIFDFYLEDGYANGYTVTLYPVTNGNMHTEEISASEF